MYTIMKSRFKRNICDVLFLLTFGQHECPGITLCIYEDLADKIGGLCCFLLMGYHLSWGSSLLS